MLRIALLRLMSTLLCLLAGPAWSEEPPADALRVQTLKDPSADEYEQYEAEQVQKELARLLAAKNSQEAGEACRDLYFSPYTGYVHGLLSHDNANVAIQAAWCVYSRTVPRRRAYFGGGDFDLRYHPDVQRFLGVLEGRLRVSVPEWWERAIEDLKEQLPDDRSLPNGGWTKLPDELLKEAQADVILMLPGETPDERIRIRMSTESVRRLLWWDKAVAVGVSSRQVILLARGTAGRASGLLCLDRTAFEERWRTHTWGLGPNGPFFGPPIKDYVSIVMTADRVFIFGANITGAYVEAFELKDGTNIARFATTNWYVKKEE